MRRTPLARGTSELIRRSPLARGTVGLKRTGNLRSQSPKRDKAERIYAALRREFLVDKVCAWPECGAVATTVQHSLGRVGDRYLDVLHWLPSCWFHNGYAEDHPLEAQAAGFSGSRVAGWAS